MKKKDLYYERIPTKLLRDDVRYLGNVLGQVIRAVSQQPTASKLMGINVQKSFATALIL